MRSLTVRRTAPWLARLALFALLFQISAIDHHSHPEAVTGVVGTSAHELHCHGALGSCANGGGEMASVLTQPESLPAAPSVVTLAAVFDAGTPADAELAIGTEPPRIQG